MPEPPGRRSGSAGCGPLLRLLVAGDSGAAGVGADRQDQALCGQLVRRVSLHHTVQWCVLAVNGLDSPGLLRLLQQAPCARFDVVVLSLGANDATGLCPPQAWARWKARLALPEPLRWFMGRWARQMNHSLAQLLTEQVGRRMHWHPETTTTSGMAADGIHPSAEGYAAWADGLSRHILAARAGHPAGQGRGASASQTSLRRMNQGVNGAL